MSAVMMTRDEFVPESCPLVPCMLELDPRIVDFARLLLFVIIVDWWLFDPPAPPELIYLALSCWVIMILACMASTLAPLPACYVCYMIFFMAALFVVLTGPPAALAPWPV